MGQRPCCQWSGGGCVEMRGSKLSAGQGSMKDARTAYVGLGSNLGEREQFIREAVETLGVSGGVEVRRQSTVIETPPLGPKGQGAYLNCVVEVETTLGASQLWRLLVEIEDVLGRQRGAKWGPRTIDLDLLLYGDEVIESADLRVPHSQMHLRSFVLEPLAELEPGLVHPVLGATIGELAERLNGGNYGIDAERGQLIGVAGLIGVGKTTLAERLAGELGFEMLREPYDTNPFLADVYAGRTELALDSELYFLAGRMEQLDRRRMGAGAGAVSDYVFDKQAIFARRLLDEQQFALFERYFGLVAECVAEPVLVVYLRDTAGRCLERIHRRNRPYEQGIEAGWLEKLGAAFDELFSRWTKCPVIRLDAAQVDCRRDADLEYVVSQVRGYVKGEN